MGLTKEQENIISHDSGNILVSASAGSGKTFVMIERLISLILEKKTHVKNILCVTFTESAASEMKEKLRKAIIERINLGEQLEEELLDVDSADVCTIHSFCARLIRKYFFVAEISPDFKVCDEVISKTLIEEAKEKTFKELYEKGEEWFLSLLNRHYKYRTDRGLKELILSIYKFLQVFSEPKKSMQDCLNFYTLDFDETIAKYKRYVNYEIDGLLSFADHVLKEAKELEFTNAIDIVLQISDELKKIKKGDLYDVKIFADFKMSMQFGRKIGEEKEEIKAKVKILYKKMLDLIARVNKHITTYDEDKQKGNDIYNHLDSLLKVVRLFTQKYDQLKREENYLDFNDLEHFALKIVRDEPTIKTIKEGYDYIFADEYQDVNSVQEELLNRLSNNNLFVVGDVKQSIYGFRGCRPEFFIEKEASMQKTKQKTVRLNHNFRSSSAVLDMANEVFSYSMTRHVYGTDYKKTSMLLEGGVYPKEAKGRTALHLLIKDEKKGSVESPQSVYSVLDNFGKNQKQEVSKISLLIEKIIREELGKTYYDTKEKRYKNVTYSDVVILNRNRDNDYIFSLVKDLLKLGVPVSSEVTENVCEFAEVQVLINLLKLIDCKDDDVSLVTTLKSPIGNFSEEELFDIASLYKDRQVENKRKTRFYLAYNYALSNASEPLKTKLVEFDKYIDKIRFLADFMGAGKILEKVIGDSNFESFLVMKGNFEEKLERVNFFINKALDGKIYTVHEFLALINNSSEAFYMTPTVKKDSVKLMTIHASKGLEFPVVIVCGLEKKSSNASQYEEVLKDFELGLGLKNYDDDNKQTEENVFRGLFKEKMRLEKVKEELRLLYVALTRASYSMHLTLETTSDKRGNFFIGADKFCDYIPKSIEAIIEEGVDVQLKDSSPRKVLIGEFDRIKSQKIKEDIEFLYPYQSSTILPLKCSVTSATKRQEPVYEVKRFEERTGTERGVTAHKILEKLDFSALERMPFKVQVENMIKDGVIEEQKVRELDLEKIESAVKEFSKELIGKKILREQWFTFEMDSNKIFENTNDKILVQGIIDLLVLEEDGARIYDYKYSVLGGERLLEKYALQLNLYGYAVEKVLGLKIKGKTIVNILSGEVVEVK